jgi:hypothetical protein
MISKEACRDALEVPMGRDVINRVPDHGRMIR